MPWTRAALLALVLPLLAACGDKDDDASGEDGLAACPTTELTGPELPCDCYGTEVFGLPGDGSSCFCREGEGFVCEGGIDSGDTRR